MSLLGLLSEVVSVVRYAPTTDEYGNTQPGAETRVRYSARLEQLGNSEIIRDRDTVIADYRIFLPADADITPYDRIEARGCLFEVVGLPDVNHSPRGPHHKEANLRWVV